MSKPQTALSEALTKAGYRPPSERLLDLAIEAWTLAHPQSRDQAMTHLKQAVIDDAELLWELFQNWWRPAAERTLLEAAVVIRERREAEKARKSVVKPDDASLGANTKMDARTLQPSARGSGSFQPLVTPSRGIAPTAEQKEEARSFAARTISKLDTFKVNGRPIGDCTPTEALQYRDARARDNRFISMITQGVPANMRIKDCITPQEAEAFYQRAQEEPINE